MPEEVGKILQQELLCRFFNPGKGKGAVDQVEEKMNKYGGTRQEREELVKAFNHHEPNSLRLAQAKILHDGSIDIIPNNLR
jgi:hypothetical protein